MSNRLVDILREAKQGGFDQAQRHQIAVRYREGVCEYLRIQPRPLINNAYDVLKYFREMDEHAAIKARGYMKRHEQKIGE